MWPLELDAGTDLEAHSPNKSMSRSFLLHVMSSCLRRVSPFNLNLLLTVFHLRGSFKAYDALYLLTEGKLEEKPKRSWNGKVSWCH